MSVYDPNQQPAWTPPPAAPQGYTTVPADAQPTTGGDRWALIALAVSISVVLSSCIPGFACLAPLIVGIIALVQAKNAVDPSRARTYGWIATGIGIVILLLAIGVIALYGALFAQIFNNPEFRRNLER
jgi:Na+-driven multidrug efflux pump